MYRLASIRLSDVLPITNVYNIPIPRYVQFKMAIYNVTMCNDWWLGLEDSYIIVTVFCSFFWQRFQVASEKERLNRQRCQMLRSKSDQNRNLDMRLFAKIWMATFKICQSKNKHVWYSICINLGSKGLSLDQNNPELTKLLPLLWPLAPLFLAKRFAMPAFWQEESLAGETRFTIIFGGGALGCPSTQVELRRYTSRAEFRYIILGANLRSNLTFYLQQCKHVSALNYKWCHA